MTPKVSLESFLFVFWFRVNSKVVTNHVRTLLLAGCLTRTKSNVLTHILPREHPNLSVLVGACLSDVYHMKLVYDLISRQNLEQIVRNMVKQNRKEEKYISFSSRITPVS